MSEQKDNSNYLEMWNNHIENLSALRWNVDNKADLDKLANIEITLKAIAKRANNTRMKKDNKQGDIMNKIKRMEHNQICIECGCDFKGFEKQHTCHKCITIWIKNNTK